MKIKIGVTITAVSLFFSIILGSQPLQKGHDHARKHLPHMERSFEDVERWAKDFDDPNRDEWQMPELVIETLALQPGQIVADIGAGTGYFAVRLAQSAAAPKVYAIDIEPSMVEYVRQRATRERLKNVVALLAKRDNPNLPEPVDLVLIVNTYHHLPNRVTYFTALRKLLRPSGRMAIVDYRKGAPDGPPEEFRFNSDEISDELSRAGFAMQAEYHFLPRQIFLVYRAD